MKITIKNENSMPENIRVFFTRHGFELKEHQENGKKVLEVTRKEANNADYQRSLA